MANPPGLRVGFLVGGFPPDRGVFNARAAAQLSHGANLRVIYLRAWKRGRPLRAEVELAGFPVTVLAVPQIPGAEMLNLLLYRKLGYLLAKRLLQTCD
jgi:hypothetical protein